MRNGILTIICARPVAVLGPLGDFPYSLAGYGKTVGVVTNLTCAYDYYCPVYDVVESSCDGFGGNAAISCIHSKYVHV